VTSAEEFIEFAAVTSPRLRRTAFLLCGDWHTAEDLAQATLAKVFGSWRRISRKDAADAYATRTLVNTYLADRRRKRVGEVLVDGKGRVGPEVERALDRMKLGERRRSRDLSSHLAFRSFRSR